MAPAPGRKLRVAYDPNGDGNGQFANIAIAKSDKFAISNEPIDITGKDDGGVKTLLNDIGMKSFSISMEGIVTDPLLLGLAMNAGEGTSLHWFKVTIAGLGDVEGRWFLSSFETAGGAEAEAMTFTGELQSSGAITFTAASN